MDAGVSTGVDNEVVDARESSDFKGCWAQRGLRLP